MNIIASNISLHKCILLTGLHLTAERLQEALAEAQHNLAAEAVHSNHPPDKLSLDNVLQESDDNEDITYAPNNAHTSGNYNFCLITF